MENILYLLLGWLLGLLSPKITTYILRPYQIKEIKNGIFAELREAKFRMALSVHTLSPHYVPYDRGLLTWLHPYLEEYDRIYPGKNFATMNNSMLKLSDAELHAIAAIKISENPKQSYGLKTYSLPFLESHIGSLAMFNTDFQKYIMKIRAQISLLNEEVIMWRFYFEKTFDDTSTHNYEIISNNLSDSYKNVARLSRKLVDDIDQFIASGK